MVFALAKFTSHLYTANEENDILNYKNIFAIIKELIDTLGTEYHFLAYKLNVQFILTINEFDKEKHVFDFHSYLIFSFCSFFK